MTNAEPKGIGIRLLDHVKAWPMALWAYTKNGKRAMGQLPSEGPWEPIMVYVMLAALLDAFFSVFVLVRMADLGALRYFLALVLAYIVVVPLAGFVLHAFIGALGQAPGFYRTTRFIAEVSLLGPLGVILLWLTSLGALVPKLFGLYLFYLYCLEVGKVPPKKAVILVGIFLLLSIVGILVFGVFYKPLL